MAYFHPCVPVYDGYNGWDRLQFTGAKEFYNDFSDYNLKVNAVEGFVGMEYPMMANDGAYRTNYPVAVRFEENHEIAHTYFPFYMDTNESRFAFMDEGWLKLLMD